MKKVFLLVMVGMMILGCGGANPASTGKDAYRQVSSDEARNMMETASNYIIVDVRTQREYTEGHIPKAICIPNEEINKEPPALLPDKEQELFVYCQKIHIELYKS